MSANVMSCTWLAICVMLQGPAFLSAQVALSPEQEHAAEVAIQKAQEGRMRVRRGVCDIDCTNSGAYAVDSDREPCFCAFDLDKMAYRFGRNVPKNLDGLLRGGGYLAIGDHFYYKLGYADGDPTVFRKSRGSSVPRQIAPFSIHAVGLFNLTGGHWKTTMDGFFRGLSDHAKIVGTSLEAELLLVEWVFPKADAKTSIWFDPKKDFAWVKVETVAENVLIRNETNWEKINKCWVPASRKVVHSQQGERYGESKWVFHWRSVNEPVPKNCFLPADLAPDQPIQVYDGERESDVPVRIVLPPELE